MTSIDVKSFDSPDETIPMGQAYAERVSVAGVTAARAFFKPGWRYTKDVDTDLCSHPHAAYIVSGRLHITMGDSSEVEAGPGEVVVIEPGHDAWTVGDETCVFIDFGESVTRFAIHESIASPSSE